MIAFLGLIWVALCIVGMTFALQRPWHEGEDPTDDASP